VFFYFQQAVFEEVFFSYIGFNFILSAIALGGFFFVPSVKSFVLVILTTPVAAMILSGSNYFFHFLQIPMYSLPFNLMVVSVLLAMSNRTLPKNLHYVTNQQYSPEKNLYKFTNSLERFKRDTYFHVNLPFYGEWKVSQGHGGGITHIDEWQYAWDFVVTDENGRTHRGLGRNTDDYYCDNLPVLAPAAGCITDIVNEVDENEIGNVNIARNWGNTVIIKHGEFFYSKLSHLKKGSIRFGIGEYVKRSDVIGNCGNSGRSPEPHIHFQLQANPYIDDRTISYPISYYILSKNNVKEFRSFEAPKHGETVSRVITTKLLRDAFQFTPGKTIEFDVRDDNGEPERVKWQIFVDAYNYPYIYCHDSGSYAYFVNNETVHYFTDFVGDRNSLLYYFYLGANKVLLGYYPDLEIKDILPLSNVSSGFSRVLQDFIAPFHIYMRAQYSLRFTGVDNENNPGEIRMNSSAESYVGNKLRNQLHFEFVLEKSGLKTFTVTDKRKIIAECVN
jgi:murein DD-endopeptidase MepM/ murein hydrolase activator NlpD